MRSIIRIHKNFIATIKRSHASPSNYNHYGWHSFLVWLLQIFVYMKYFNLISFFFCASNKLFKIVLFVKDPFKYIQFLKKTKNEVQFFIFIFALLNNIVVQQFYHMFFFVIYLLKFFQAVTSLLIRFLVTFIHKIQQNIH